MVSELQRVARGLVECLDEAPQAVAHLQRTAARCRENAGVVIDASHGQATVAALQLDAAARACEEAAHYLAMAPVQARDWAERLVGGARTSSRPSAGSAGRNRTTGGTGDLAGRKARPIEAELDLDPDGTAPPDRRPGDDDTSEQERRLVAQGNKKRKDGLRYDPGEPAEPPEPIEVREIEVELPELVEPEDEPRLDPIEVEPVEVVLPGSEGPDDGLVQAPVEVDPVEVVLPESEGERPDERLPLVPIEVEPVEAAVPESDDPRQGDRSAPDRIDVQPIEVRPDGDAAR
jgi:hypothetical protein